jgi:hypothetical protein
MLNSFLVLNQNLSMRCASKIDKDFANRKKKIVNAEVFFGTKSKKFPALYQIFQFKDFKKLDCKKYIFNLSIHRQ